MTVNEIARCLYKPRWADIQQHEAALQAFERLSASEQEKVYKLGEQYS